ncbi:MAG: phosphatidylglycerophosphatase A family protein [Gammaproteobacteria bacterium]
MSTTSANKKPETKTKATKHFVFGDIGHCIACGFGAGLTPKMPGTAGTVLALPLYYLMASLPFAAQIILLAVMLIGGIWLCGRSAKALAVADDGGIVFDEITGFYAVLLFLPDNILWQAAGFVVFRILDAAKPPPIGWLDKNIGGGFGIMLDDIAAAAATAALLNAAMLLI